MNTITDPTIFIESQIKIGYGRGLKKTCTSS